MRLITILLLTLVISISQAWATTFTVCSSGCDSTTIQGVFDGQDLAPGDIVEVQADTPGGSKTYQETITPGANDSGDSGSDVVLQPRSGDTITIDGNSGALTYALVLTAPSYFSVYGFIIENFSYSHIYIGSSVTDVSIQYCTINIDLSLVNGQSIHGIIIGGTNPLVEYCTVTQSQADSGTQQADGITGGNSTTDVNSPVIRYSTITIRNTSTNSSVHSDGIQITNAVNPQIYGNTISLPLNNNYRQGLFLEFYNLSAGTPDDFGTGYIYNNLIYGYGGSYLLSLYPRFSSPGTENATVILHIYNNTLDAFNNSNSLPFYTTDDNIYFKNNVVFVRRTNAPTYFFNTSAGASQTPSQIDYNCYYVVSPSGDIAASGGTGYVSWSAWQTAGYDANGLYTDPSLDGSYRPDSGSDPVVNVGVDLSGIFTTDRDGNTRSLAFDIGAYEFVGGTGSATGGGSGSMTGGGSGSVTAN